MDQPPHRSLLSRFDIGSKLFLAFSAIAGLTFLAAVVAWLLFDQVSFNTTIIADQSVPGMERSFQLAQESTLLSVSIPRFGRAQNVAELTERKSETLALLDAIDARLATFVVVRPDSSEVAQLDQIKVILFQMRENLSQLFMAAKLDLAENEKRRQLLSEATNAHRKFVDVVDPLVQVARDAMIKSARRSVADGTAGISSLIDDSFDALRAALEIESNINLLIASSYQAASTTDPAKYFGLISANVMPISRIKNAFNQINDSETSRQLRDVSQNIIAATTGRGGIFDIRGQILRRTNSDLELLRAKQSASLQRLDALQQKFAEVNGRSIASVDESILNTATRLALEGRGMIDRTRDGVRELETMLLIRSGVNQLFGLLNQAATAISVGDILPLQKRYLGLRQRLRHLLASVRTSVDRPEFQSAADAVARYGSGKQSIIDTRRRELLAHTEMAYYLEDSQRLASELSQLAATFVVEAKRAAAAATTDTLHEVASGKISVVGIAIVCFLAVVLIAWLFVARGIVRRLRELTSTMLAISDGRLETPISIGKSDDEISDMSRSLVVFRDNAMKRRLAEEA
ncbi:MAG: HAMP domain-containing protein, partial [Hyphomicrobiaceae bacterium]